MNGIWNNQFQGIIPHQNYTAHLSAGEESGLILTLESAEFEVVIDFGAVDAVQMLDEGVLLQGENTEQLKALREQGFTSTIYEIEEGDLGCFIEAQMGSELYHLINCRQYNIITINYLISIVTHWDPKITVTQK